MKVFINDKDGITIKGELNTYVFTKKDGETHIHACGKIPKHSLITGFNCISPNGKIFGSYHGDNLRYIGPDKCHEGKHLFWDEKNQCIQIGELG